MLVSETTREYILFRLCAVTFSYEDAEDALQDAFVRFFTHFPPVRNEQEAKGWLLTVARRRLMDLGRHADNRVLPLNNQRMDSLSDTTQRHLDAITVRTALHRLSPQDRTLIQLKAGGFECQEIADAWQLPEEAVKKRLQRARSRFGKNLSHQSFQPHLLKRSC